MWILNWKHHIRWCHPWIILKKIVNRHVKQHKNPSPLGSGLRSWPETAGKGYFSLGLCHRQGEQQSCPVCSAGGGRGPGGQWWNGGQRCCTTRCCTPPATSPSSQWRQGNCPGGGFLSAGCQRTRAPHRPSATGKRKTNIVALEAAAMHSVYLLPYSTVSANCSLMGITMHCWVCTLFSSLCWC